MGFLCSENTHFLRRRVTLLRSAGGTRRPGSPVSRKEGEDGLNQT